MHCRGFWRSILKHCHSCILYDMSHRLSSHFLHFSGFMQADCYCSLRAIRKTALSALSAASQLLFAHEMALPSYIHAGRFSCEHEICPQECTSELDSKRATLFTGSSSCFLGIQLGTFLRSFGRLLQKTVRKYNRWLLRYQ